MMTFVKSLCKQGAGGFAELHLELGLIQLRLHAHCAAADYTQLPNYNKSRAAGAHGMYSVYSIVYVTC